jgi:hypothetical protein
VPPPAVCGLRTHARPTTNSLQASPLTLYAAPRVSVLHASFMEYLLEAAHARYNILAQWPDFSTMFGKDYYYRCGALGRVGGGAPGAVMVMQTRCLCCSLRA